MEDIKMNEMAHISNETEIQLIRDITKGSFYRFVQEFWHTITSEEPVWNWHIKYLCDELQTVAERVFAKKPKEYDVLINVPPGSTKTSVCSVMLPVWIWTRMPNAQIIACSHTMALAHGFSRKSREVVKSDLYMKCFPEIQIALDQATHFMNTRGGERYAVGVGGTVTGKHAHVIVLDDPIAPAAANSEAGLAQANL